MTSLRNRLISLLQKIFRGCDCHTDLADKPDDPALTAMTPDELADLPMRPWSDLRALAEAELTPIDKVSSWPGASRAFRVPAKCASAKDDQAPRDSSAGADCSPPPAASRC